MIVKVVFTITIVKRFLSDQQSSEVLVGEQEWGEVDENLARSAIWLLASIDRSDAVSSAIHVAAPTNLFGASSNWTATSKQGSEKAPIGHACLVPPASFHSTIG